jgi:hypothetical protein
MEFGKFENWNLAWHDYLGFGGFSGTINPKTILSRHDSCHIGLNRASIFSNFSKSCHIGGAGPGDQRRC